MPLKFRPLNFVKLKLHSPLIDGNGKILYRLCSDLGPSIDSIPLFFYNPNLNYIMDKELTYRWVQNFMSSWVLILLLLCLNLIPELDPVTDLNLISSNS